MGARKKLLLIRRPDYVFSLMDDDIGRLKAALDSLGVETVLMDSTETERDTEELFRELRGQHFDAAFGMEEELFRRLKYKDVYFMDALGVPFYNWEIDHPMERFMDMENHPDNYHLLCIDRNHVRYVRRVYPEIRSAHFLPLPGYQDESLGEYDLDQFMRRDKEVIFTGVCFPLEEGNGQLAGLLPKLQEFTIEWIERLLANRGGYSRGYPGGINLRRAVFFRQKF